MLLQKAKNGTLPQVNLCLGEIFDMLVSSPAKKENPNGSDWDADEDIFAQRVVERRMGPAGMWILIWIAWSAASSS